MISIGRHWAALLQPAGEYCLASRLFLKLLAVIYFSAFLSLAVQITGLAGAGGILPVTLLLDGAAERYGSGALLRLPTVFWLNSSDLALQSSTLLGCLLALLLLFGIWPRLCLVLLFLLYLSLCKAGQLFMNFQWDYLLLEAGLLAVFLPRGPPRLIILMYHWLLFRLRFMSGVAKLASGDPSWAGLTALNSYFQTQPLPHTGSWYAHQLPEPLLQAGVILLLVAELLVPLFIFLPRKFRLAAALITIALQLLIIATSNHNFFNLLTILLCLLLLDDDFLRRLLPSRLQPAPQPSIGQEPGRLTQFFAIAAAGLILSSSLPLLFSMGSGATLPEGIQDWTRTVRRFGIGNGYHVFPTMQTERVELEIEGSRDGHKWQAYTLPWKPGPADRRPAFIVPHQPRLDWMLWFVPAQQPQTSYWFDPFMRRLWEGSPDVTALLAHNPFPAKPPRYLRVKAYRYRFTTPTERRHSGHWWRREYLGLFPELPPRQP